MGRERVNINKLKEYDNTPPAVTGGYILSIDRPVSTSSGISEPQLTIGSQGAINIIEPKLLYPVMTTPQRAPQLAYIQNFLTAFATADTGPNSADPLTGFRAYIDLAAAIDHHVVNTFTFNLDALRLSAFFYNPRNGLLTFGPSWDF